MPKVSTQVQVAEHPTDTQGTIKRMQLSNVIGNNVNDACKHGTDSSLSHIEKSILAKTKNLMEQVLVQIAEVKATLTQVM